MLRRAMGKKIKSEMDAQRERFVKGAIARDVKADLANFIFDLLAKFADYGFNKSHAAAYALIAYQTAWFKTHYPAEFLAASMTFDKSQTDKLAEFRDEARRMGIAVEPPSINESGVDFDVAPGAEGRLAIRYAFSAIKGVGEAQAESLVRSRGARQFASLADVARRLNPREVNKKTLESLAACGAFDEIEPNRARAFAAIEAMLAAANRHAEDRKAGQNALFGEAEAADLAVPKTAPWPAAETLRREYEAAGFSSRAIRSTLTPGSAENPRVAGANSPPRQRARPPAGSPPWFWTGPKAHQIRVQDGDLAALGRQRNYGRSSSGRA
jgi:DNA polymerase-3 subunit alpha